MSDRPAPTTRSEELLCHLIDEIAGLRSDLAGRGGAPRSGAPKSEPAKAPAKKTAAKGKKPVAVDGR